MTYTDIHCRSIFAEFQNRLSQIHPDSNILPTYLAIIASNFEANSRQYSKIIIDSIFIRTLESPTTAYVSSPCSTRGASSAMRGCLRKKSFMPHRGEASFRFFNSGINRLPVIPSNSPASRPD
ncbi:hypothetical protein [Burkholderia ambifaria]|uniref:hypothetical protein n=1 Tax=Burkholderia ambifaria TaxID=152480 RepID=UPI00158AA489|nr:hypothetical protein [Burkholderia ambifaria]